MGNSKDKVQSSGTEFWYAYLLVCADGTYYAGVTTDPRRRCAQHNAGTGARYTRSRLPVTLVYVETCADRSSALRREMAIKRLTRAGKQAMIIAATEAGMAPTVG